MARHNDAALQLRQHGERKQRVYTELKDPHGGEHAPEQV